MSKLPVWYTDYKDLIESSIPKYLDMYLALPMTPPLEEFKSVIRYSFKGGKKLRSILALEFYLTLSQKKFSEIRYDDDIVRVCIAIEAVHAYSLLHDDLPCMDNDELRRGELTTWKKFGEYKAVLAGDFLNTLCFEILSDIKDANMSREVSKLISHSVGFYGMIGGQIEDIYYEHNIHNLDTDILRSLHGKKTGKLIEAAILSGVTLSGDTSNYGVYKDFGKKLGLAFQVKDDLLDVEGTPEETGKSVGGEEKGFVYLIGVDATRRILSDIIAECHSIAHNLGSEKIDFIVDYIENRKK